VPDRERFDDVAVYDGHALLAGNEIVGPALIERTDTTIFVTASYDATVDPLGSIVLQAREHDNV
jgi:N-methylhydantoinase A/oxoprolinase/acetone carboxylase beta subunit